MSLIRLQKFLSLAGLCSRRQGEAYIQTGLIRVNGQVVTQLGTKIDPSVDRVAYKGQVLREKEENIYVALHKPAGVVTSRRHRGEKVVIDLVDLPQRLNPVGRLDRDSSGLLLLTNDGRLHHQLTHPSFDHEKQYDVTTQFRLTATALRKMAQGVVLDAVKTRPARVRQLASRRFEIVLKEGRKRQIRRMVRKVGNRVETLKRTRMANINLGGLPEGAWRYLTAEEKRKLLDTVR